MTQEDDVAFRVVVNDEEQYSIWPVDRETPAGWRDAGRTGTRQECLDHIERTWTDMRPLSLRRALAAEGGAATEAVR
ncbi:MbtH family protein [Micromonospora sp. NPDC023644]|uniref:MbtH family protein n=1 Tax=Micromonospora sp. NPDC023644 TaxID=3154321 RepID=UPI0033C20D42